MHVLKKVKSPSDLGKQQCSESCIHLRT